MTEPAEKKAELWRNPELRNAPNQTIAAEGMKAPETRARWLDVLNSGASVALVTVVLGTVLGAFLSSSIQEKSKKNDTELASYKEYLERERQVVQRVFHAIGTLQAAGENLIAATGDDFDSTNSSGKQKESVEGLKRQILQDYNTADTQWRTQELQLGLEMDLEHQNDPAVISAWQSIATDMRGFSDCAKRWVTTTRKPTSMAMQRVACNEARSKLDEDLHGLTRSIVAARERASASIGKLGR